MRRIDLLITRSRSATNNSNNSDQTGIQDEDFLQWASDAQARLYSLIQQTHPEVFLLTKEMDVVANQLEYDLAVDVYLGCRIEKVEHSSSGQDKDYHQLRQRRDYERRNQTLRLNGALSSGKLKITYQRTMPRIDKRRGTVSAVALDDSALTITSLTLDATVLLDFEEMNDEGFITIVDKYGAVKMKAIPVTSVDGTTGVVTVDPDFVFEDGETIAAGDFAVLGEFSSTHSQLNSACERYLLAYMNYLASGGDAAAIENKGIFAAIEGELVGGYSEADFADSAIPEDSEWMG